MFYGGYPFGSPFGFGVPFGYGYPGGFPATVAGGYNAAIPSTTVATSPYPFI